VPVSIQQATLLRAARKLGGCDALAAYVHAPRDDVTRWVEDGEEAPEIYFLRGVEALLADEAELHHFASRGQSRLALDARSMTATVGERVVALPATEWAVLESLRARLGRVVWRPQIRRELALWAGKALTDAIHMYVFRLRLKLEPLGLAIHNVRPGGYVLHA